MSPKIACLIPIVLVNASLASPFGAPQSPGDPTKPISMDQAVQLGLVSSPLIVAATHTVSGFAANYSGQRQPLNPFVNVLGTTGTPGFFDQTTPQNFGVNYTLEISGRQGIRTKAARAQLDGAKADGETTRQSVVQAIRTAYVNLQLTERSLEIEQTSYDAAKQLSDLTEQRFDAGASPETDAIRARVALAQEEQSLEQAKTAIPLAKANLNIQIGHNPTDSIEASEKLEFKADTRDLFSLDSQALAHRTELKSAEASKRALDASVELERAQSLPDLVIGANPYAVASGQVMLFMTFPLFDFGSIRGSVKQAQENVKAQQAQIEQTRQSILLDVRTAYLNLQQSKLLIDTFNQSILARAASLLSKVQQGYKLGGNTILDVLDAEATYRSTQNDYANAVANYDLALVQLDHALGTTAPSTGVSK